SCIKKSDDMGSSDFDPFSEIVKRSVLTDRHYGNVRGFVLVAVVVFSGCGTFLLCCADGFFRGVCQEWRQRFLVHKRLGADRE
ncbi:hypothetical protein, partial [Shewanella chilikensis]|uniref:hypothetical protein n=1 Tax=Shewanella chilikensis TaxID=558541 RepID=UPI00399B2FEB